MRIESAFSKSHHIRDLGRLLTGFFDETLTVLCYHRVGPLDTNRFQGFRPNLSASPEQFARQMKLLRTFFSPVTLDDVFLWRDASKPLPKRAVLVTFDDGYRDNGDIAWPIMRDFGIPGIVFLATDYIGSNKPFLWDFAAYCFESCKHQRATIPLIGERLLSTSSERQASTSAWVAATKQRPARDRSQHMEMLSQALDVSPPAEAFADLCMDWEMVRHLKDQGLEFGGHTRSHPILTRTSRQEAEEEIIGCQTSLVDELGQPARAFAYPNGSAKDYSSEHADFVRAAGFSIGFSLEPGPTQLREVRQQPMAVRRIYIGRQEKIPRILAKCTGMARVRPAFGT